MQGGGARQQVEGFLGWPIFVFWLCVFLLAAGCGAPGEPTPPSPPIPVASDRPQGPPTRRCGSSDVYPSHEKHVGRTPHGDSDPGSLARGIATGRDARSADPFTWWTPFLGRFCQQLRAGRQSFVSLILCSRRNYAHAHRGNRSLSRAHQSQRAKSLRRFQ